MKRGTSVLLAVLLLLVMNTLPTSAQNAPTTNNKVGITQPDYQKLDSELVKDLQAAGKNVKGKDFVGKSYIKPEAGTALPTTDVRNLNAKNIAILVDFPTKADGASEVPGVTYDQVPSNKFDDLFNGDTYNPFDLDVFKWLATYNGVSAPIDKTMKNYYQEVSYGQYKVDVEVVDWVTLSHDYDYYFSQDDYLYNDNGDARIGDLVLEAVRLADPQVDFSEFAVNGEVPNIFIIHRGTGAEYNLDPTIIWSHKWDILSARYFGHYYQTGEMLPDTDETVNDLMSQQVFDGVLVNTYNVVPEVGQDITGFYYGTPRKPSPAYVGVYAHEFGHSLGLPDQYDYGYESEGTGMFTLMAGGSYGNSMYQYYNPNDPLDKATRQYRYYSGNSPVHMNAWDKNYLGFLNAKLVSKNTSLTLKPVTNTKDVYKIVVPGSFGREYFLLENRQQNGFDVGLSYSTGNVNLHGLVVYHVVDDMILKNTHRINEAENWDPNHLGKSQQGASVDGQTHYGISVIQADGQFHLEKGLNDGDATDVFPGLNKVTSLSSKSSALANTTSVFKWSNKSTETGINLKNIKELSDGTITLDVVFTK